MNDWLRFLKVAIIDTNMKEASNFFRLNWRDVAKGLVVAVCSGLASTTVSTSWEEILKISLASAGGYLLKNLFSSGDGKFLGSI